MPLICRLLGVSHLAMVIRTPPWLSIRDVTAWTDLAMTGVAIASQTSPQPLYKAKEYSVPVTGLNNVLVDYCVEAVDSNNNVGRSPTWVETARS